MILKNTLLLFTAVFVSISINAQTPPLDYIDVSTFGDGEGEYDEATALVTDVTGNVYGLGILEGAVDFDPSEEREIRSSANENLYLAKYSPINELVWVHVLTSPSNSNAIDIDLDANGDLVICANYVNEIFPNPNGNESFASATFNNADIFLGKYSTDGEYIWGKSLGGGSVDTPGALITNSTNEIYLTGAFSDTADFDPSASVFELHATGTFQDPYLAKYDESGNFLWAFSMPGSGLPGFGWDVELTSNEDVLLAGSFNNNVDFDPSPADGSLTTNGNLDGFVARYSPEGNYQWGMNVGGFAEEQLYRLAVGSDDSFYISGYFNNVADFDPSASEFILTSSGNRDIFLAAYHSDGSFNWAFPLGNSSSDMANALEIDSSENLYIGGYFVNAVDFDPSAGTSEEVGDGGDFFIASYDSSGAYRWVSAPVSDSFDRTFDIESHPDGYVVAGGSFRETVDADPGVGETLLEALNGDATSFVTRYDGQSGSFISGFAPEDRAGSDDEGKDVAVDSEGNVYMCGVFNGGVDFDVSESETYLESGANESAFVIKTDAQQNTIWAKSFSGTALVSAEALYIDSSDNVLISGYFAGAVDFDPGAGENVLTSSGSTDCFVVKLSSSGDFIWAKSFGGPSTDAVADHTIDSNGDILVTGYFRSTADFDPGAGTTEYTAQIRDAFVVKLNSAGDFQWAFAVGDQSNDYGNSISTDADDNVYLGGQFRFTVDFDPSGDTFELTTGGNDEGFVSKYNSSGEFLWAAQYGGTSIDRVNSVDADSDGNIYVSGIYRNTAEFNHTGTSMSATAIGFDDIFLLKVNSSGETQWAKSFGTDGFDYSHELNVENGLLYLAGNFNGDTVFFDLEVPESQAISNGGSDGFVSVFDTNGNYMNSASFGGPSVDDALGLAVGEDVFVTGSFLGTADFQPGADYELVIGAGDYDAFLLQLGEDIPCTPTFENLTVSSCESYISPSGMEYTTTGVYADSTLIEAGCYAVYEIDLTISSSSSTDINETACDSFTWSTNDETYTESGSYIEILTNAAGCDSTVTLNLTINEGTSGSESITACDSFTWEANGETYAESGAYSTTLTNAAGCDSTATLNLTINNSNSGSESVAACDSFTWSANGETFTESGSYTEVLTNAAGCDSTVTLNLTINESSSGSESVTACDQFTWSANDETYTESGDYIAILTNEAGCDSTATLELTINESNSTTQDVSACDSYVWDANGLTLDQSGTYTETLTTSLGCDSVVTLNLSINNSFQQSQDVTACGDSYFWDANETTYDEPGEYSETFQTAAGCDSVVTLNLTFEEIDLDLQLDSNTLSSSAVNATFQWLDCDNDFAPIDGETSSTYTATENGTYALEITTANCTDTTDCIYVEVVSVSELAPHQRITVYPNPTAGVISIDFENPDDGYRVILTDIAGRKIAERDVQNTQVQLEIDGESGLYFLRVFQGAEPVRVFRVVKQD